MIKDLHERAAKGHLCEREVSVDQNQLLSCVSKFNFNSLLHTADLEYQLRLFFCAGYVGCER